MRASLSRCNPLSAFIALLLFTTFTHALAIASKPGYAPQRSHRRLANKLRSRSRQNNHDIRFKFVDKIADAVFGEDSDKGDNDENDRDGQSRHHSHTKGDNSTTSSFAASSTSSDLTTSSALPSSTESTTSADPTSTDSSSSSADASSTTPSTSADSTTATSDTSTSATETSSDSATATSSSDSASSTEPTSSDSATSTVPISSFSTVTETASTVTVTTTESSESATSTEPTTSAESTSSASLTTPDLISTGASSNAASSTSSSSSASATSTRTPSPDAYLSAHNAVRAGAGVAPLAWSAELAANAQTWASLCLPQTSGGIFGQFGENMVAGTGDFTEAGAVGVWANEAYDPANPIASHLTQIVWKSTQNVGCGFATCLNIFPGRVARLHVCQYDLPGNIIGAFGDNVLL